MYPSLRLSADRRRGTDCERVGDGGATFSSLPRESPHRFEAPAAQPGRVQDALREQAEVAYQQTLLVALQDGERAVDLAHNRTAARRRRMRWNRRELPQAGTGRYGAA